MIKSLFSFFQPRLATLLGKPEIPKILASARAVATPKKRKLDAQEDDQRQVKKINACYDEIGRLVDRQKDGNNGGDAAIDLLCLAHQVLAHHHQGADATQGNVLFELQTMRVLNRFYPLNKQLVYCGNARNQPDAKQGSILHEFKSRKIDGCCDNGGYCLRLKTLMGTWQFPDTDNIILKMSDPDRRVTYALRCPGKTEPVFLVHIHSAAGRLAEIAMYRRLTNKYVMRKQQQSRVCKKYVPIPSSSCTAYSVNLGDILDCVGENDYNIFVYGKRVEISHKDFYRQVQSKQGFLIPFL